MPPPDQDSDIEALQAELAAARATEAELRQLLAVAHDQLAQRDEEMVQEVVWRSQLAQRRVEEMRRTRVWRVASAWWGTRDRVRGAMRAAAGRRRR